MSVPDPVLSYVGAIDLNIGSTMYNIFFDPSITTNGNVLMFEYKLQPSNVTTPNPDDITLGFIDTENSNQSIGISNQWQICVPAQNNSYDPSIPMNVCVRVYYGLSNAEGINVTSWSNILNVHNPPRQPNVTIALYDTPTYGSNNDLYVVMSNDSSINYSQVKFIVTYYYQNVDNTDTVWAISDPLQATEINYNNQLCQLLTLNDFGAVSTAPGTKVYVSVYAVYPFAYEGSNYFSVSQISETYAAENSSLFVSPTMTGINYLIYSNPPSQIMVVNWDAPAVSIIYTVDHYILEYSTDTTNWAIINDDINTTTYDVDVSGFACDTNISYRVSAVSTSGAVSPPSNMLSKNMFRYAEAPSVTVYWAIVNAGYTPTMDVNLSFSQASAGCGSPIHYAVNVLDASGVQLCDEKIVEYNDETSTYYVKFDNITYSSTGTVTCYLVTQDTNSDEDLSGATGSAGYVASSVPIYVNVDRASLPHMLSFDIVSSDPLAPIAGILVPNELLVLQMYQFNTTLVSQTITINSVNIVITITPTITQEGEHIYSVVIAGQNNADNLPIPSGIVSANSAGVGELSANNGL